MEIPGVSGNTGDSATITGKNGWLVAAGALRDGSGVTGTGKTRDREPGSTKATRTCTHTRLQ